MPVIINKNIDLFVDFNDNEIQVIISENNQVIQYGKFKKTLSENLIRFFELFKKLKEPLIISFNLDNIIYDLVKKCRIEKIETYGFFNKYLEEKHMFINANTNPFLGNREHKNSIFVLFNEYLFYNNIIINQKPIQTFIDISEINQSLFQDFLDNEDFDFYKQINNKEYI